MNYIGWITTAIIFKMYVMMLMLSVLVIDRCDLIANTDMIYVLFMFSNGELAILIIYVVYDLYKQIFKKRGTK